MRQDPRPRAPANTERPRGGLSDARAPASTEQSGVAVLTASDPAVPAIPVSAGALIFDRKGRLLVIKPTYKSGWTIPGGVMEANGESPWEACVREVREECGLTVTAGVLACVDFRRPRPGRPGRPDRPGGVRFLFDCGRLDSAAFGAVVLQPEEIAEYQVVKLRKALTLLRGPIRRRVAAACAAKTTVYLEEGRPVGDVMAG